MKKSMKKGILSILLVLCMILGLLPMPAFATDIVQVTFRLNNSSNSISKSITPSDTTLYYTTNTDKKFVVWDGDEAPTDNDSYIKVYYPVADEPVVYVTLNKIDAAYSTSSYGNSYHAIYFGEGAYSLNIILQGENTITTGTNACIHTCASNGTTITGSGSLTLSSTAAPGCITVRRGNLLIKDTTLNITNTSTSWRHAILLDSCDANGAIGSNNLTIEGSTVNATTNTGAFVFFGKVTGTNTHGAAYTDNVSNRTLNIRNSTVTAITAVGSNNHVFKTNTSPVFEYSNITASCSVSSNRLFRVAPTLVGMNVYGSVNADGTGSVDYNPDNLSTYRYVQTTHTCTPESDDCNC